MNKHNFLDNTVLNGKESISFKRFLSSNMKDENDWRCYILYYIVHGKNDYNPHGCWKVENQFDIKYYNIMLPFLILIQER